MRAQWRKSSFSGGGQASCVEVSFATTVRVRDSKNPDGGLLSVPPFAWSPAVLAELAARR
ncbi:hypothetical protein [Alloactinosynnema sp. L-07]|uniref:DUF397 domain-containing protein n=1 Tax=Alloactinosynnema sp. L-07 TaxID=1653480 RepID=UPI00065F004D|nr:DUF397 domain-containing protein [Alloactinosynnema sp. L-07]CRK56131.1 hypothetical protein [Alloactinosynnema sp. L-07]